jgi:hypothetical protein
MVSVIHIFGVPPCPGGAKIKEREFYLETRPEF